MSTDELNDIKRCWQTISHAQAEPPDDHTLQGWLQSSSGALDARLRRAALMDCALKAVLLLASIGAGVVFAGSASSLGLFAVAATVSIFSLALQLRLLARIPEIDPAASSALTIHRALVNYFDQYGRLSAAVHSLTSPLVFAVGSAIYLSSKYGALLQPASDDLFVFCMGVGLAFSLHFLSLRAIQLRQQRYLFANLQELESDALDQQRLREHRAGSDRLWLALLILMAVGSVVLILAAIGSGG